MRSDGQHGKTAPRTRRETRDLEHKQTEERIIMDETVTISRKEYDQLKKDTDMLNALKACVVDNWEGYSEAHKYLREQEEEQK